jgi:glycosyltransferase involved in cell wall biosynthesis
MTGDRDRPISVLVISQYYEPDIASSGVLLTEICEGLAADGFDVRVVTAQPSYTESSSAAPEHEIRAGVEILRVSLSGARGRVSMRTRLRGYLKFLFSAKRAAARLAREKRPDIILTASNPPLLERVGRSLAKDTGARWAHVVHDIHPDVLLAGGQIKLPPLTARIWKRLSSRAMRHADRVVVLSGSMKRNLVETKGVDPERVEVISLWAIPEVTELPSPGDFRARLGIPEDHLLITHTGNIGIIHGLEPVLDAAADLRNAPVTILFIGDGATKSSLERKALELRLTNVKFAPFQSKDDYLKALSASDACLVTLRAGMEKYSLPSKTFTILAAGKPIIGLLQPGNDVSEILAENHVGWNSTSAIELAERLRRLSENRDEAVVAGANARDLYERRFTRVKTIEAYRALLTDLAREPDIAK